MNERDWLVPSMVMTALLGAWAVLLMPFAGYDTIPPYLSRIGNWVIFGIFGGGIIFFIHTLKLILSRVDQPIASLRKAFEEKKFSLLAGIGGLLLAGTDLLFFMWIKPEVTAISPFWADKIFADLDRAIFMTDPWRFFRGFDLTFHAWAYSFFWAAAIMSTLVWLLLAKAPSRERTVSLLSYFALWSIFGPIGQYAFSSAGPIFYQRIGLGDRFADLSANVPQVTNEVASYLWSLHTTGGIGVGAGISAMPSMHIATVVWMYLAFRGQRSWVTPFAALFAFYIFVLSVALRWHYAIDGIAGAAGALGCQIACGAFLNWRERLPLNHQALPSVR